MKRLPVLCAFLLASLTGAAPGQEFRATVNGRVVDPSKAAVPNATITVRNLETNESATVTTGSEGNYAVPFLKPGTYGISVEAPGFKKHSRERVVLQVGTTATV